MSILRSAAPSDQSVSGSVVFGDVVQVSGVSGEVVINTERPTYRLDALQVGASGLPVEHARAQPSRLLMPRYQVVPFVGRDAELAELAGWVRGSESMSVRLIHAGGGHGKTRLARHAAAQCAAAGLAVWRALHTPVPAPASQVELPGAGKALVVADYADRWPPSHLFAMLTDLCGLDLRTGLNLRVLLLARSAGFWWSALADRLDTEFGVVAHAQKLRPLGAEVDRAKMFHTAREHFAAAMRVDGTESASVPKALEGPAYASVLTVHMAALVAVDAYRRGATTPNGPHRVSAYLLRREYTHWHDLHARSESRLETSPSIMSRAVYVATLVGPLHRNDARTALQRVHLASTVEGANLILDDHRFCYPPVEPATVLEALQPDRLGEDLLAISIPGHPHADDAEAWPVDDWATDATRQLLVDRSERTTWSRRAITVLVEAAHRWPHVASRVLFPLVREFPDLAIAAGAATLTRLSELPNIEISALEAIDERLPRHADADLDVAAAAIAAALTPHRLSATVDPAQHAKIHNRNCSRFANAGRNHEALASAELAVEAYGSLAADDPDTYLPYLGMALTTLGQALAETGQTGEALLTTKKAFDIWFLLGQDDYTYWPELVRAVHSLSKYLSEVGRRQEAVFPIEAATAIIRTFVEAIPDRFDSALAAILHTHATCLVRVGRHRHALASAEESVAIRRRLASRQPTTTSLSDLATSLNGLSLILATSGRRLEAMRLAEEVLLTYRKLANSNPDAYLPELGSALSNLAVFRAEGGESQAALTYSEEAVSIDRRLADINPVLHLPALAMSLGNLANRLGELGLIQRALGPAEEALLLRRRLVAVNPAVHMSELGMSLHNLAIFKSRLGRHEEAITASEECAGIYRELATGEPGVFVRDLASALGNLAGRLTDADQYQDALAPATEAVSIWRQLSRADQSAESADLALSLSGLAMVLAGLGDDTAVHAAAEAVLVFRRLVTDDPAAFTPKLARSLWAFGSVCHQVKQHLPEAIQCVNEAIQLYAQLLDENPGAYASTIWSVISTQAELLDDAGRRDEATDLRNQLRESERRRAV